METSTKLDLDAIEVGLNGFSFDRNEWTPRIIALIARVRQLERRIREVIPILEETETGIPLLVAQGLSKTLGENHD